MTAAGACLAAALTLSAVGPASAEVPTGDPTTYTTYPAIQDPGASAEGYFQPLWLDDEGAHIQAHGGQIVTAEELGVDGGEVLPGEEDGRTVYYWYGEDRSNGYYGSPGVHAYKSYDTMNWIDQGVVLRSVSDASELESEYFDALYDTVDDAGQPRAERIAELNHHLNTNEAADYTTIFERPKVLFNESTGKWVLWWHSDGQTTPGGSMYARSMAGVAVSDSATGPFKVTGVYRMPNRVDYRACTSAAVPGQARDMTVFQDDDGAAYIVYSSEENRSLYVAELDADYTNVTHTTDVDMADAGQYSADGRFPYLFADGTEEAPVRGEDFQIVKECGMLEAPALFQHGGKYYAVASGATGWAPNPQTYYTADSILGSWVRGVEPDDAHENVAYNSIPEGGDGLLSVGDVRRTTFGSQSTNVLDLGGGRFVYMGDRWNDGAADSTYVWLPITIGENGRAEMRNPATEDPGRWSEGWDASYFDEHGLGDGIWSVVDDRLPETVEPGEDFSARLPATVPVEVGGATTEVAVTWSATSFGERGAQLIVGTLAGDADFTAGRQFTRTIEVATPGVVNLALASAVAASSRQDLAGTTADGNVKGKGWDDWRSGGVYPKSSWLSYSWAFPQDVDEIAVHTYKDGADATWPSSIAAEYLDASGAWVSAEVGVDLTQDASATAPVAKLDLSAVPATNGVRLQLKTATNVWQSISEVQLWGTAGVTDVCGAAGTVVSASFHQTMYETLPALNACDGSASTPWSTWDSTKRDQATFTIEPRDAQVIDRLGFTNTEGTIAGVNVEYRDAHGTWHPTTAQNAAPSANGTPTSIAFSPVLASAVRLTFATPGSYLKIPVLAVGGAAQVIEPAASVRCVAGKATVVTSARNAGSETTSLVAETRYGSKEMRSVAAGATASAAFTARMSAVPAGEVVFESDGGRLAVGYPALTCG